MSEAESKPERWDWERASAYLAEVHRQLPDRAYAFVLGAGASIASGVPSARELARKWLDDMVKRDGASDRNAWLRARGESFADFDDHNPAAHYTRIFDARFEGDDDNGQAALEAIMKDARPGVGYAALSRIMHRTRHSAVVTTNFDNLVAEAAAMLGHPLPLVVGHEALCKYVRPRMRRPLVAKVHRDLLLAPKNRSDNTKELPNAWRDALKRIFGTFTPIVMGYGGNDPSLMLFLESLKRDEVPGRLIWCAYETPSDRVQALVAKLNGVLVDAPAFDELMLRLVAVWPGEGATDATAEVRSLVTAVDDTAADRRRRYEQQWIDLVVSVDPRVDQGRGDHHIRTVLTLVGEATECFETELGTLVSALIADTPQQQQDRFLRGIERWPESAALLGNYANFLDAKRGDLNGAEALYKRALDADPENAHNLGNYANFLDAKRGDLNDAEALYKRALEVDPENAVNLGRYANFLDTKRRDLDGAEALYKRAIDADPENAFILIRYAYFRWVKRGDLDGAEALFKRVVDADQKHPVILGIYAYFRDTQRGDLDGAATLYKRALEADPKNAFILINYAAFLAYRRGDVDGAEALYKRALEVDPKNAGSLGNYASFLWIMRGDLNGAEALYKRALEVDPENAVNLSNYAAFLLGHERASDAEIRALVDRALAALKPPVSPALCEALLCKALLRERAGEAVDGVWARLKGALERGYDRQLRRFDGVFDRVLPALPEERQVLYRAIGAAVRDAAALPALNASPLWQAVHAADPFGPENA